MIANAFSGLSAFYCNSIVFVLDFSFGLILFAIKLDERSEILGGDFFLFCIIK